MAGAIKKGTKKKKNRISEFTFIAMAQQTMKWNEEDGDKEKIVSNTKQEKSKRRVNEMDRE